MAWSPDKLCKHQGHTCNPENAATDQFSESEIEKDLLNTFPGRDKVDILGIDLYYAKYDGNFKHTLHYQTELFRKYLRVLTRVANDMGKVAALTETGNYNLANEHKVLQDEWNTCIAEEQEKEKAKEDEGSTVSAAINFSLNDSNETPEQKCGTRASNEASKNGKWFTNHLLELLTDPDIEMAYTLTWENRSRDDKEYYIPFKDHPSYEDFINFSKHDAILMKNDLKGVAEIKNQ